MISKKRHRLCPVMSDSNLHIQPVSSGGGLVSSLSLMPCVIPNENSNPADVIQLANQNANGIVPVSQNMIGAICGWLKDNVCGVGSIACTGCEGSHAIDVQADTGSREDAAQARSSMDPDPYND